MHKFRGIKTSTPARAVALWAARSSWGRLESLQIHQMLPLWFFWTLLPNFFFLFFCSPCRHLRPCLFTITVSDSCHGNRHKQDPNRQSSVARPSGCHRCFLCSNKDVHCRRKNPRAEATDTKAADENMQRMFGTEAFLSFPQYMRMVVKNETQMWRVYTFW